MNPGGAIHGGSAPSATSGSRDAAHRPAHARIFDLIKLALQMGAGRVRHGKEFDARGVGCRWARQVLDRDHGAVLEIALPGKHIDLVGDRQHSQAILDEPPDSDTYGCGDAKTKAMRFLAPHALTIASGEDWKRLRPFNEFVVGTGAAHPYAQAFLDRVRAAFARAPRDVDGLRASMEKAMIGIVLGDDTHGAQEIADDVQILFDLVQHPVKRRLFGWRHRGRRKRMYESLSRAWVAAAPSTPTLLARARHHHSDGPDRVVLLEQMPHWMFTFTGSGTDLLARTLAVITSRPDVLRKVQEEMRAAGPLDRADSIERLPFLEACILETGRLFPPVTRTYHTETPDHGGERRQVLHWFPLLQRDETLGATVHAFSPARWSAPSGDAAAAASNLFLRGPRACPGRDLIVFVCKAALVRLIADFSVTAAHPRLTSDPLPVSFPPMVSPFPSTKGPS